MIKEFTNLEQLQRLVLDIIKVERNHYMPETNRRENVVEHSFSLGMLCWKIYEVVKPPLDITKILKYALVHDFTERGQVTDTNTYAKEDERQAKKKREALELAKLTVEFKSFPDLAEKLKDYEECNDEEALFVWSVDKMQAPILGQIDNWRPYREYGINYKAFSDKGEELLAKCSPYLKDIFKEVFEEGKRTYYDRPL